jgi:transposase InsO family protein
MRSTNPPEFRRQMVELVRAGRSPKRELLDRSRFRSQTEAKMAVFRWIEGWYNPRRRCSSLGRVSPLTYERRYAAA